MKLFTCTFIISLFIICSNQTYSQTNEDIELNKNQIDSIATVIFITQINYDILKDYHERYQNRINLHDKDNLYKDYTRDLYDESTSYYDQLSLTKIPQDLKSDLYVIESYYPRYIHPQKYYSLAITKKGNIYLLNNFWVDEFEDLIKEEFLDSLNIEKASKIMELYFNIRHMGWFKIINKNNLDKYKKNHPNIIPIQSYESTKHYHFSFYAIQEGYYPGEEDIIMECNFTLTKRGDVSFNSYIYEKFRGD